MKNLKKALSTILLREAGSIRACVAGEALKNSPQYIQSFFRDLAHYGCVTWMVWSLIYYHQTHAFFDTHYYEIMDILWDLNDQWVGITFTGEDLKNRLAWLAFEEVAYHMALNDLGLDF